MTYWMVNGSVLAVLVVLCACTPYVVRKNDVFGVFFPDSASQLKKCVPCGCIILCFVCSQGYCALAFGA